MALSTLDNKYPDPSKLLVDNYAADPEASALRPAQPSKSGLVVTVQESGPEQPWLVQIVNHGNGPAELIADSRLMWFEVKAPGQKKSTSCKLPDELGPSESESRLRVTLLPGEGVIDTFDPRLYCFAEGDQKLLVPGAEVTPHFGWAEAPPKKHWKGGKRVEEPALQRPPFVAGRKPNEGAKPPSAESSTANDDSTDRPHAEADATPGSHKKRPGKPNSRLLAKQKAAKEKNKAILAAETLAAASDKELVGSTFALNREYAIWSHHPLPPQDSARTEPLPVIGIRLVQGSDAKAEYNATVQMTLENQSNASTHVYFRRELVTFEVTGPKGVIVCDPRPDDKSPDKQAFIKLAPHAKQTFTSRLAELCPRGTFAAPGLYLVYGTFTASLSGEDMGLHAFTGQVQSEKPAAVRIRTGEVSLLQKQMMPIAASPTAHATVGGPSPTPASTPAIVPNAPVVPKPSQAAPQK
jgi:hypothetical protein